MTRLRALPAVAVYISLIALANILTSRYGLVPVGFGLAATAGVYAAGATLTVRDTVQEAGGRWLAVVCILAGAALSAVFGDGRIAVASCIAFLLSELADLIVYTLTRPRGWTPAVWLSFLVAAPFDTVLFLWLAGFPITGSGLAGQLVGKTWATAAVWALTVARRRREEVPCSTS